MKNNLWIAFFYFLSITISTAQYVNIKGKVVNDFDVEGIHVLNKTSKYNTITNQFGEFELRVQLQDTLLFSSIKFELQEIVISEENISTKLIEITLTEIINELDEVLVGNTLTGNLAYDIKNIKTEKDIDFDDVGIPGFKGIPQERIIHPVEAFFPTNINIEAVYKHISGYYKKLKIKRKWTSENTVVVEIIDYYGFTFFEDAYGLPKNRVYDFMLFCIETSSIQSDFKRQNFAGVLQIFKDKSKIYISRLVISKEQIKN
ncbi:MAG: carboxypeptidase-like regulatory domain-containing protein [Flavobacteriaceae bacterium]|nr:carboxypeptidase-like regulatory domain-containing protein [Flavobacteriaceae bacterium]